jgi:hypothetical protein
MSVSGRTRRRDIGEGAVNKSAWTAPKIGELRFAGAALAPGTDLRGDLHRYRWLDIDAGGRPSAASAILVSRLHAALQSAAPSELYGKRERPTAEECENFLRGKFPAAPRGTIREVARIFISRRNGLPAGFGTAPRLPSPKYSREWTMRTQVRADSASFSSEDEPGVSVALVFPEDDDLLDSLIAGSLSVKLANAIVGKRRQALKEEE